MSGMDARGDAERTSAAGNAQPGTRAPSEPVLVYSERPFQSRHLASSTGLLLLIMTSTVGATRWDVSAHAAAPPPAPDTRYCSLQSSSDAASHLPGDPSRSDEAPDSRKAPRVDAHLEAAASGVAARAECRPARRRWSGLKYHRCRQIYASLEAKKTRTW